MTNCFFCTALQAIGGALLFYYAAKLALFIKLNYFTSNNIKKRYLKAGAWAVVTGASDGIGLAMANDLARRGMNVVVISRTLSKLEEIAESIRAMYKVEAKAVAFDFSSGDYAQLFKQLEGLEIAVLVNNVGVNYDYCKPFDSVEVQEDASLIKVNCEATVRMTKFVLPHMKERRCGAIVNLSSFSALHPTPLLATYAGTKAFVKSFSEALSAELKSYKIDVMAVTPNMVISRMTSGVGRKPRKTFMFVDAAEMAKATLNQLGSVTVTNGHPHHGIIEGVLGGLLPTAATNHLISSTNYSTYARAEKKKGAPKKVY